jgi:hypothetical protein
MHSELENLSEKDIFLKLHFSEICEEKFWANVPTWIIQECHLVHTGYSNDNISWKQCE